MKRLRWLAGLALLAPTFTAHTQALPDLGEAAQAELTPQMEKRIGEQVMRQIRRDPDFVNDPEVSGYVQSMGQRLVAVSADTRQEFEFFVVRDPQINAFAMPGGYVGVHTGLIIAATTEAEVASVLAHEISHVTQRHMARQLQKQNQVSMLSMIGMVAALLAARSSPGAASAAMAAAQAAPVAAYLSYSRDFEREADRVGFQLLQQSGYDVFGMPTFFEKLQQASRSYDNNAPVYLRSHPLTTERIGDMHSRTQNLPVKQTPDSAEFQLVRAKLRAEQGRPEEAVDFFRDLLRDKRFINEAAARYGYAVALARAKDYKAAQAELAPLRKLGTKTPMFENLAARIRVQAGEPAAARGILDTALVEYPENIALRYTYAEVLQTLGQQEAAIAVIDRLLNVRPRDVELYSMRAKSFAALGNRLQQHRSVAEAYYLQGSLSGAIEQLQLAQLSGHGDFYALSAVDARIREFRREQIDELAESKGQRKGP